MCLEAMHCETSRSADRNSAKDAVAAMIKRLAHRNANVQLYTLEVRRQAVMPDVEKA